MISGRLMLMTNIMKRLLFSYYGSPVLKKVKIYIEKNILNR